VEFSVVQEVRHGPTELGLAHGHPGRRPVGSGDPGSGGDEIAYDRSRVEGGDRRRGPIGLQRTEVEQAVSQGDQLLGVDGQVVQGRPELRRCPTRTPGQLERGPQPGQWRAQLMAGVGHEQPPLLRRRLQVVQGVVERLSQATDLIVGRGQREADARGRRPDLLGLPPHPVDRSQGGGGEAVDQCPGHHATEQRPARETQPHTGQRVRGGAEGEPGHEGVVRTVDGRVEGQEADPAHAAADRDEHRVAGDLTAVLVDQGQPAGSGGGAQKSALVVEGLEQHHPACAVVVHQRGQVRHRTPRGDDRDHLSRLLPQRVIEGTDQVALGSAVHRETDQDEHGDGDDGHTQGQPPTHRQPCGRPSEPPERRGHGRCAGKR